MNDIDYYKQIAISARGDVGDKKIKGWEIVKAIENMQSLETLAIPMDEILHLDTSGFPERLSELRDSFSSNTADFVIIKLPQNLDGTYCYAHKSIFWRTDGVASYEQYGWWETLQMATPKQVYECYKSARHDMLRGAWGHLGYWWWSEEYEETEGGDT